IDLHPYRLQAVHQLREADYPVRAEYCRWFLNTPNENLLKSFFIDEVWFYLEGYQRLNNLNELCDKIITIINERNNNPRMLANVSTAIVRRVQKCFEVDGDNSDYL
ncbi:hypothetical protein BDFB_014360, partial [Asbolus verrucosus]